MHVALVAETKDEVLVTEVSVVLHQMPENWPRPDCTIGFGTSSAYPRSLHAGATAKQNYFHGRVTPRTQRTVSPGDRHDKVPAPLADITAAAS